MKIGSLPAEYKLPSRFSRPADIKADTHHLYTTEKYVVEIVYHSSMFYAPDFYSVRVKDISGKEIWNGGESYFLDTLFRSDFVSDEFDRMVLTRVNSTASSKQMQIVMIDLKSGKEEVLTEEGFYSGAGHFISFDCVYYIDAKGVHCIDYGTNSRFLLHDVLEKYFTQVITWGACIVRECMLVVDSGEENNVCLFNLRKQQVIDSASICWEKADSVSISVGYTVGKQDSTLSVSYSDKQATGALKHRVTTCFNLAFE